MTDPLKALRRTTAVRGAFLSVGMRWSDRLLGLASTLILARLLVPEDFGLVAMAMIIAGLLDVLLDLGVAAALVQNTQADSEDFHTAWTLRLCQAAAAAITLAATAPLAASYFGDERVAAILRVVAITAFVGGLENIGTVSFQKNMEFGRDFQYFVFRRVFGVVFTIAAAFILRSYWALVFGALVSRLAGVAISYWISAFRPHISFARFWRIWSFSQWNLLAGIGHYLANGVPKIVVGRRADATVLGAYSVGEEIALMPTTELLAPLGRVMFPVFAAAKHDPTELLRVARLALSIQALVAIPAGIGVALVADDAISILLGAKWLGAADYAQIIALASIATALTHSATYMLLALGRVRTLAAYSWLKVAMLLALVEFMFPAVDARGVAFSFLATAFGGLVVIQILARQVDRRFGGRALVMDVWRPLLSAASMAAVVLVVSTRLATSGPMWRLLVEVIVGAVTYGLAMLLSWRLAGSPAGAETYLFDQLAKVKRAVPKPERAA